VGRVFSAETTRGPSETHWAFRAKQPDGQAEAHRIEPERADPPPTASSLLPETRSR